MRIAIAGGHGQIALLLASQLIDRGDHVVGIVRNSDHSADLEKRGIEPAVLDLESTSEDELAEVLSGADAAVFAAGAGPNSGGARKDSVDRAAAALFAETAVRTGVRRHVQISSMGLDRANDPTMDPVFSLYLKAKAAAEEDLRAKDLEWTILRPGRLSNEPATGLVTLAETVSPGSVSRADVAATVAALVRDSHGVRQTLELTNGQTPIAEAVAAL
jgi:uncharacterized protein YbjT (DUF2867 family)